MAQLARAGVDAGVELPLDDDPGSDARTDGNVDQVLDPGVATVPQLGQRADLAAIGDMRRHPHGRGRHFATGHVEPTDIDRGLDDAGGHIDQPRRA